MITDNGSLLMTNVYNLYCAIILPCVLLLAVWSHVWTDDPYKCGALMNEGLWLDEPYSNGSHAPYTSWQPEGCMMHQYTDSDISACVGDRRISITGDSTTRQVFWALARKLNSTSAQEAERLAERHRDQNFTSHSVKLEFIWDPFLNSSSTERLLNSHAESHLLTDKNLANSPSLMMLGGGAWFARWLDTDASLLSYTLAISNVTSFRHHDKNLHSSLAMQRDSGIGDQIFIAPVPIPEYDRLDGIKQATIVEDEIEQMNEYLRQMGPNSNVLWSYLSLIDGQPDATEFAGFHVRESVADVKADILLNLRCNAVLNEKQQYPFDRTCCSGYPTPNPTQKVLLVLAGCVTLVACLGFFLIKEHSASLTAVAMASAALAYCYLADRTQVFAKVSKHFVSSDFGILSVLSLLAGLVTMRRSGKPNAAGIYEDQPFLSRNQTEEWKGWMQLAILIYHYTGASSILPIYQVIRLFVASYLFLTGFGHTAFFLRRGDFSFRRAASVLVRLNLLSCVLTYVMGTEYLFYYFAPLVSFWFGVVWVTMRVGCSRNGNAGFVAIKIILAAAIVEVLLRTSSFEWFFAVLESVFNIHWSVHEWTFRLSLDRYIVFAGMLTALLYEHQSKIVSASQARCLLTVAIMLSILTLPLVYHILKSYTTKPSSNAIHPYLSIPAILAFVALRNATATLRNHHSVFFAWVGSFSLETFVLQYHIWLAADTKGLLSLGIWSEAGASVLDGGRWKDFMVLTPLFLWVACKVAGATGVLTACMLKSREEQLLILEKPARSHFASDMKRKLQRVIWPADLRARSGMMLAIMWIANWL